MESCFFAERVAELDALVKDLEIQLAEQEESANTVIAKWQESCTALEEKNTELTQSLAAAGGALQASGNNEQQASSGILAELQKDLEQTKAALATAQEKLEDDDSVVVKWERKDELSLLVRVAGNFSNYFFFFFSRTSGGA